MTEAVYTKRIYYHDTDCGGVVYYANYLKHFEEARTAFLSERGIDLKGMSDEGTFFVVAKVEIAYKSPARYQDLLLISTKIERLRLSAIHFAQRATKEGALIVEAETTLVCVGNDFKPKPIPEDVRRAVAPPGPLP